MLVDKEAQIEVKQLYSFLQESNKSGIMFGHQDSLSYGIGWKYDDEPGACDIEKVCGDYPAVFGWDLGHIETGSDVNIDKVPFDLMRSQIGRAHAMGGINTISWHPTNPVTGGNSWDTSVRVVEQILPGGKLEAKFRDWLTVVAEFLNSLIDQNGKHIPIAFRPFHEHTGSWFWWGDDLCTQQEFIQLWQYSISFIRDTMGVHNLLYIYSPDKIKSTEEYLFKYPGDEWVDMFGLDVYDFPHQGVDYFKVLPECLDILSQVAVAKNKPYALTETGNLNVAVEKWWTDSLLALTKNSGIAWFLVWINLEPAQYYGPYPGQISAKNFVEFYNNTKTIFLKDMPSIYEMKV